jgi:hypothetical protein
MKKKYYIFSLFPLVIFLWILGWTLLWSVGCKYELKKEKEEIILVES